MRCNVPISASILTRSDLVMVVMCGHNTKFTVLWTKILRLTKAIRAVSTYRNLLTRNLDRISIHQSYRVMQKAFETRQKVVQADDKYPTNSLK